MQKARKIARTTGQLAIETDSRPTPAATVGGKKILYYMDGCKTCFYWFMPGIAFSFIKSLTGSWALLVEINR